MSNRLDIQDIPAIEGVGLQGFICPKVKPGEKVSFDFCIQECPDPCEPLPLLLSMMSHRVVRKGVYSVTEILNPPQIVYLSRNNPYWVEPMSMIWMTLGRGWHEVIEGQGRRLQEIGKADDYMVEQSFATEVKTSNGPVILTGTMDLGIRSKRELWDFKTVKSYFIEKMHKFNDWSDTTYGTQINLYKHHIFPEATTLVLDCLVKDWNRYLSARTGIRPIEKLYPPILPPQVIQNLEEALLDYNLQCQAQPGTVRDCVESELWTGQCRCQDYCQVSGICPQYAKRKEANETNIHPKRPKATKKIL
jgi:hypothetical protein